MPPQNTKRIFLSHDGAVDELMALALLAKDPAVDLAGISLVNGDCLAEPTLLVQAKLLRLLDREDIGWSLSGGRAFNAFPWEYRADCVGLLALPILAAVDVPDPSSPFPDGERHLAEALRAGPMTLIMTGPLTPLQLVLEADPGLEANIDELIWMGGAIDVPGNLDPKTLPAPVVNSHAEWNVFWDPFAVDWVLRNTSVPITLAPLDVSDAAPISKDFLARLRHGQSPLAQLAAQAYAMVAAQPFYRLWDVVTACAALDQALFEPPVPMQLAVETWGKNQGWIRQERSGRDVNVLMKLRVDRFYNFVVERFRQ